MTTRTLSPASVLRHVSNTPSTIDEIAARCGSTSNKVHRALDSLQAQRAVIWQSGGRYVLATPELLAEQEHAIAEEDAARELVEHANLDALRTLVALRREALSDNEVRDAASHLAATKPETIADAMREASLQRLMLHALAGTDEGCMELVVGIVAKLSRMTETELERVHWSLDRPRWHAFCAANPLVDDAEECA